MLRVSRISFFYGNIRQSKRYKKVVKEYKYSFYNYFFVRALIEYEYIYFFIFNNYLFMCF